MKKPSQIKGLITGLVIGIGLTATTSVFASSAIKAVFKDDLKYIVNGESVTVSSPAIMESGSTYLKLRDVSNMLGYDVGWNAKTSTITLNNGTASNETVKETVKETTKNEQQPTGQFAKLPITITKGDYTLTVNSIKRLEYKKETDIKNIISVTVTNNSDYPTRLVASMSSLANVDIKGEESYSLGVPYPSNVYKWESSFKEKTKTIELPYRATIKEGTKNIRLGFTVDGLPHQENDSWFIFNIDATDI